MAIPKQPTSPPPYPTQLVTTPGTANGAKKSTSGCGGKDVKQRANLYVSKLADRDTEAMAATELESMARALPAESLPSFLSAISDTRPSDKTPLRRHCLRLLSVLSRTQPPQSISPFLPRMVSSVLRRLRDPDSSVRSACVDAVRDMSCCSSGGASASFCSVFLKPLSESLLLEQDHNAQMGSAMCLAAAIDEASASGEGEGSALDHDLAQQLHRLVPRLVKLSRSDGFKAKPALLSLLGSIVAAGGASSPALLDILVPCLADALSSEDWATRKAASEALTGVAAIPYRHLLSGFKSSYFSSFQARRFDKVKIVRDCMNQMLEVWKYVPGALGDEDDHQTNASPSQSRSSSARRESESDGRLLVGSRTCGSARSSSPHTLKKDRSPVSKSPPTDVSPTPAARRRTPPRNEKRTSPPLIRNLDRRKIPDWKIEIAIPRGPPFTGTCEDELQNDHARGGEVWEQGRSQENASSKLGVRRLLFEKNAEQRVNKFGCLKLGSRVVPYQENGNFEQPVEVDELFEDNKDNDLSLIHKQLLQIETQQSSLLDLVQTFIGNSQNGIRSLETRVHGIEMALDEISYDLAMSSGRMSNTDPTAHCCKIPGAEFLSSKFWRRNEGRYSSRLSISGTSSSAGVRNSMDKGIVNSLRWEKQGFGINSGFVINPLAEVNSQSRGNSYVSSGRTRKNTMLESGCRQVKDGHMIDETSTITGATDVIRRSSWLN